MFSTLAVVFRVAVREISRRHCECRSLVQNYTITDLVESKAGNVVQPIVLHTKKSFNRKKQTGDMLSDPISAEV